MVTFTMNRSLSSSTLAERPRCSIVIRTIVMLRIDIVVPGKSVNVSIYILSCRDYKGEKKRSMKGNNESSVIHHEKNHQHDSDVSSVYTRSNR